MERLQKVIAQTGYCSRRKAEELIQNGKVEVNGRVIKEMGVKVNYDDDITINGEALNLKEDKVYYVLNKPRGIITSTSDEKNRKTVVDLVDESKRIYPVGRLDYDTTGVLLLTNDGELTNLLIHPRSNIEKLYIAKVNGIPSKEEIIRLSKGVIIDGRKTSKAKVKIKRINKKLNTSLLEITIHEGRNHQIKKMIESIGYEVIRLRREKFAFLDVNSLKPGEYRKLTIKEVKSLYALTQKND
jgi:23S rRNA pseudouridine2605 synthase